MSPTYGVAAAIGTRETPKPLAPEANPVYNVGVAPLVGRGRELARLRQLLARARAGRGSALLVAGEPGIGKSVLLAATEDEARDRFAVLRTTGRESEHDLPFAALRTLLDPVLDRVESLPPPQSAALKGAFALESSAGVDPFGVAAATLGLLTEAAERRPLLCLVDDAQWLDEASASSILFVAARVQDVPAAVLLAAREGEAWPRGLDSFPRLRVSGLSPEEGVELLARQPERYVEDAVARDLVRRTGGNPLALLELQSLLDAETRTRRSLLTDPLPVSEMLTMAFTRRLSALPDETRAALMRAAADPHLLPDDVAALEPAEDVGLITVAGGQVEFSHPLLRSAVYHGATPAERRRAHAAIAESLHDDASARRALHLAYASPGPSEEVAGLLEASARASFGLGGVSEAARLLELAARFSPDTGSRARRLTEAAMTALFAGDVERAGELVEQAAREAPDEPSTVRVEHVRGLVELWQSAPMTAYRTLVRAGERAATFDRELAAGILSDAIWPAFTAAEIQAAIATGEQAYELAQGLGGLVEQKAGALLGSALVIGGKAGQRQEALTRVARLLPEEALLDALAPTYALTLIWLEDFETADSILRAGLERARAAGAVTTLPMLLASRAELLTWRADLRAALASASEAAEICAQLGVHVAYPYVLAVLSRAQAITAAGDEARANANRALEFARAHGIDSIEIYAACALGVLALGEGRPAEAIAVLQPLQTLYTERSIGEPNSIPWLGDLAEAAALADEPEAAGAALADLDTMAERTGSRWAAGVAARTRVLAAPVTDVDVLAGRAVALLDRMPFEWARTHLVHGERRRRDRRRAEARGPLRLALAEFERMDAQPWAERARRELAAAGETVAAPAAPLAQVLSPQEFQVAMFVGEGLTNREAAARLFVSPKTVEYHLANAFRKLGVRSRTQLTRLVAERTETDSGV